MSEQLIMKGYEYLMDSTYDRVKKKKLHDENFKPYKIEYLEKVLYFFEEREEFEKCIDLRDLIKSKLEHDKNYKKL